MRFRVVAVIAAVAAVVGLSGTGASAQTDDPSGKVVDDWSTLEVREQGEGEGLRAYCVQMKTIAEVELDAVAEAFVAIGTVKVRVMKSTGMSLCNKRVKNLNVGTEEAPSDADVSILGNDIDTFCDADGYAAVTMTGTKLLKAQTTPPEPAEDCLDPSFTVSASTDMWVGKTKHGPLELVEANAPLPLLTFPE
jgi:hypothetical protein